MRLSPKIVVGLDITQPYFTDIQYPVGSFVNNFATTTIIRDTNISPKLSYQATERLALGIGFDANNMYNGQLNFVVPVPFIGGNMVNSATSWGYGFDLGLFYVATRSTFLNLAYYSKIVQHATGTSTLGPIVNQAFSADVKLPTTVIGNVIQMLSPTWALSGTIRYTQWDTVKYLVLQHTAVGNLTIPDFFFNNLSYELATHYQFNDKWAGIAAFDYEPNVQPTWTRNVGLPTYTRTIPAIGAEYEIQKGLKAKFIYAHVFSKPPINMALATGQTITGHDYLNADAYDFSITYDI
jgi:long-chain fatty acid transport protein